MRVNGNRFSLLASSQAFLRFRSGKRVVSGKGSIKQAQADRYTQCIAITSHHTHTRIAKLNRAESNQSQASIGQVFTVMGVSIFPVLFSICLSLCDVFWA